MSCMLWLDDSGVDSGLNPEFLPKVKLHNFVFNESVSRESSLLCLLCALQCYFDHTAAIQSSDQLLIGCGVRLWGTYLSKQRLVHWVGKASPWPRHRLDDHPLLCLATLWGMSPYLYVCCSSNYVLLPPGSHHTPSPDSTRLTFSSHRTHSEESCSWWHF